MVILHADGRSVNDTEKVAAEARTRLGKLDVVFLNAGIGQMLPIEAVDEAIFDEHFATNVKGQFFTLQKVLPLMDRGGSVIFNGAAGAHAGVPNWSIYTATKGALLAMVRALTATQPCVGVKPGRARWKKIALPRPRRRGAMFQSSTRHMS